MLGFLFKILLVAAIVGGVGWFVIGKKSLPKNLSGVNPGQVLSQLPVDKDAVSNLKSMNPGQVIAQVSSILDSLVTHPGKNGGPVVLGVNVSNENINTVVDVLQHLPTDQVDQIKAAFCATPSGN
jgi:hypothetical protein